MLSHLAIALMIQFLVTRTLRCGWAPGAAAASCWAISREITQAEYRWIERFGDGLRVNMPWWGGLDLRVWHMDAMIDWIAPTFAVVLLAAWLDRRNRLVLTDKP